ncbi:hypothetical protein KAX06_00690 [candidate division WOR-3 bacterium]|nr:hypothetical protein [candidate division WOR-3 bacterium]
MQFDFDDLEDERIVEFPDEILDYPEKVDNIPDKAGVYVLLDDDFEVLYVGKAGGGRLKTEIKTKEGSPHEEGATKCLWARTNSDEIAKAIESEWISKYDPPNNTQGK